MQEKTRKIGKRKKQGNRKKQGLEGQGNDEKGFSSLTSEEAGQNPHLPNQRGFVGIGST